MLVRRPAAIGLMIVALGSVAVSRPASAQNGSNGNFGALAAIGAGGTTGTFQQAQGHSRAPIGPRQPRPIDIPADPELSPSDPALRQENDGIDKKIVIADGHALRRFAP
jgi:hypothetical protein